MLHHMNRAVGDNAKRLDYITALSDTVGRTTYTFNSTSIGAASNNRLVVVCASIAATANRTINSMTIGGTSATSVVSSASNVLGTAIFALLVTSGTTANISFTASGACLSGAIHVFTLKGLSSQTAIDTDTTVAAAVNSLTLTTNYGSLVVAIGQGGTGSGAFLSWDSPLSTNGDLFPNSRASASGSAVARTSSVTVTPNYTTINNNNSLCCAAWS